MNMIENVIMLANMGAVMKPGTIPAMRFPHSVSMILEAEEAPYTSACIRVFHADTCQEVINPKPAAIAATFSMDSDEDKVDNSNVSGAPYTKEQLLEMDFETEFRAVCKEVGVVGRGKDKMIKEYLAKFA
jgi:hypothetical protein